MTTPGIASRAPECVACRAGLAPLGEVRGGRYAFCCRCGTVQLEQPPGALELAELYARDYRRSGHYTTDPERHFARRAPVFRQVAALVEKLHPAGDPRPVVELGCGWGGLGLELRERGIPWLGLELAADAVAYARGRGLEVVRGELADLPSVAARTYALVAVLEHLPAPESTLREIRTRLPPDGAIVLQVPTAGIPRVVGRLLSRLRPGRRLPEFFGSLAAPWHLWLPSPAGLRALAERVGLVVESVAPCRSGRDHGPRRHVQRLNDVVGTAGFRLLGERWPFVMAHLFVLRPRGQTPPHAEIG